jgi:hypothetical protein
VIVAVESEEAAFNFQQRDKAPVTYRDTYWHHLPRHSIEPSCHRCFRGDYMAKLRVGSSIMRRRAFISLLAAISLLMHAGFIARHDMLMLAQTAQADDLYFSPADICHSVGQEEPSKGSQPLLPRSGEGQKTNCPLCLGFGPLVAVLSSGPSDIGLRLSIPTRYRTPSLQVAIFGHGVRVPPSRGPPLNI